MRPAATVLFVLLVVFSGCSQLAEPAEKPSSTPTGPIEGTISSAGNGTPPAAGENAETPISTTIRSPLPTQTATATTTPTATATATATQTATATATATQTQTAITTPTQTATATPAATPSTSRFPSSTRLVRPNRTPTQPPMAAQTPARPPTATRTPTTTAPPPTISSTTTTSRTATASPNPGRLVLGRMDADGETVTLRNAGRQAIELDGYVVDFDDGQRYTVRAYTLRPGGTVTIHTGRGDDAQNDLYAGFFYPVINDDDAVLVETPNGRIVAARRVG